LFNISNPLFSKAKKQEKKDDKFDDGRPRIRRTVSNLSDSSVDSRDAVEKQTFLIKMGKVKTVDTAF
jgi:hypothetical protein